MTTRLARVVLATTNPDKIREIRSIIGHLPVALATLDEFPPIPPPDETGETFAENARLKALYYAQAAELPAIAEDSGLEIDALGGAPGVHSARFGGESASYPERFAKLYAMLDERGGRDSAARFVCHVVFAEADNVLFETHGTVEGRVSPEPRGAHGFGYDPIFFHPPSGMTLAEVSDAAKRAVSHRGEAFRKLAAFLHSLRPASRSPDRA